MLLPTTRMTVYCDTDNKQLQPRQSQQPNYALFAVLTNYNTTSMIQQARDETATQQQLDIFAANAADTDKQHDSMSADRHKTFSAR